MGGLSSEDDEDDRRRHLRESGEEINTAKQSRRDRGRCTRESRHKQKTELLRIVLGRKIKPVL